MTPVATDVGGHVESTPLTPAIGSLVTGIDLARPIAEAVVARLHLLLAERSVLCFRDQALDAVQQEALAAQLGVPATSPLQQLNGSTRPCSLIEDDAARPPAGFDWHTDLSWTATPPHLGVLHALVVPPCGGDTLWASGLAAFDSLPVELRALARTLRVEHCMDPTYLATVVGHHGPDVAARLQAAHPPVVHPLVRAHPVSGRPVLWMSSLYQERVVGVSRGRSARLLALFGEALLEPAVQLRWRWSAGDVVLWDETATCHRALADHHPQLRRMRRCTVAGRRPQAA